MHSSSSMELERKDYSPVSNLDSSSVNSVPSECAPNLALVYRFTRPGPQGPNPLHQNHIISNNFIRASYRCKHENIIKPYLTSFWGVKLDSHKWFRTAPFHVALNLVSHSDFGSDSAVNPADPTRTKCWTCSGCWKVRDHISHKLCHLINIESYTMMEKFTLRAYLAAT